jgi:outer membrane protein OmpA-like peptidoglycan-associated protein
MSLAESMNGMSGRSSVGVVYAPQVNIYDRDEDGLADEVDACPLEPEDEDGIDDFDGCPDHPMVTVQLIDQNGSLITDQEYLLAGNKGVSGHPMEIPAGMWNVQINSRTITNSSQEVEIPNIEKFVLTIPVQQPYQDVVVDIRNEKGKRVKNIAWGLVQIKNMHTENRGALPVGEQFIRLSADGYRSVIQKVNVDPNGKSSISVRLTKSKVRKKGSQLVLSEPVVFKGKKTAELEIRSYGILNDLADLMLSHPDLQFTIETHTDSVGSQKSNVSCTQSQGNIIKRYLMDNDIDADRLLVLAHGEKKPIANNMYRAGRKKNRRVEFRVQMNGVASR